MPLNQLTKPVSYLSSYTIVLLLVCHENEHRKELLSVWFLWWYRTSMNSTHLQANSNMADSLKSGPPSLLNSSGAPYIWKISRQIEISLDALACPWFKWCIMSQPVSLSALARYVCPPAWNRSNTICWNGQSGDTVKVMGSLGWLGAILEHSVQLALVVQIEAFIRATDMHTLHVLTD